jgi:ribonuclease HepT-like protein
MNEKLRLLKADLTAALDVISRLYTELGAYETTSWDKDRTIVVAYHLHNLYCGFEDAFQRIAEVFENEVPDRTQWHAQLLHRMTLDIEGIRPRLLSAEAFDCLDELRRFRHVFRSLYAASLDQQRLRLVWDKAQRLRAIYRADFERFFTYIDQLEG